MWSLRPVWDTWGHILKQMHTNEQMEVSLIIITYGFISPHTFRDHASQLIQQSLHGWLIHRVVYTSELTQLIHSESTFHASQLIHSVYTSQLIHRVYTSHLIHSESIHVSWHSKVYTSQLIHPRVYTLQLINNSESTPHTSQLIQPESMPNSWKIKTSCLSTWYFSHGLQDLCLCFSPGYLYEFCPLHSISRYWFLTKCGSQYLKQLPW